MKFQRRLFLRILPLAFAPPVLTLVLFWIIGTNTLRSGEEQILKARMQSVISQIRTEFQQLEEFNLINRSFFLNRTFQNIETKTLALGDLDLFFVFNNASELLIPVSKRGINSSRYIDLLELSDGMFVRSHPEFPNQGDRYFFYKVESSDNGLTILIGSRYQTIMEPFLRAFIFILFVTIGMLFLLQFILLRLSRNLTIPISKLSESVSAFASGDLSARSEVELTDEFGELSRAFNHMAQELESNTRELEGKVSERTRALQESIDNLRTTQSQLVQSEKMAALGSMVTGIAHEINTPLGVAITSASFLLERFRQLEKKPIETRSEYDLFMDNMNEGLSILLRNLQRASDMVLKFKSVAVDQHTDELRMINLSTYIQDFLDTLSPKFRTRSVKLISDLEKDVQVKTWPGIIWQIVSNLVLNALRHGFDQEDEGEIRVSLKRAEQGFEIIVQDTGKGISAENLGKVFDPFFTTARTSGGTGLGLHIIYNLVHDKLKGSIKVQSDDQGSIFTVLFDHAEAEKLQMDES
jgi:signal transduction histidine kinase